MSKAHTIASDLAINKNPDSEDSDKKRRHQIGYVTDKKELADIRILLAKHKVGIPFNTNVLRIALNM